MSGNPTALSLSDPYRLEDALQVDEGRRAAHIIAVRRRIARDELKKAEDSLAEKQKLYRRAKAEAYIKHAAVKPADAQKIAVEDSAADAEFERDLAKGMMHAQEELLKEIDGERASLHRLIDWSARLDPFASEGQQERVRAVA